MKQYRADINPAAGIFNDNQLKLLFFLRYTTQPLPYRDLISCFSEEIRSIYNLERQQEF